MKKRTIERKSKEGFLNSVAKNLGLKAKEEPSKQETREFDDLIETLRTGTIIIFYLCDSIFMMDFGDAFTGDVFHGSEKYKRSRKNKNGTSPPRNHRSNGDSNSRERIF